MVIFTPSFRLVDDTASFSALKINQSINRSTPPTYFPFKYQHNMRDGTYCHILTHTVTYWHILTHTDTY
jgi:hypothetical protein